jgi:hypothetical protein
MTVKELIMCAACVVMSVAGQSHLFSSRPVQTAEGVQQPADLSTNSVAQFSCHTLGSGETVCFSDHGNVSRFTSPGGFEHIALGFIGEGYALCSSTAIHGYDAGAMEGGFGRPTIVQPKGPNTFPLTITRDTTDGFFRLQQVFSRDTAEKDVTITMKLTNLTGSTVSGVQVVRYFDGDIDNGAGGDRYAQTTDSVWGWEDTGGHGLMLTALTLGTEHFMAAEPFASWNPASGGVATHCDIGGITTPTAPGDYVGAVIYSIDSILPGKSKTVKVLYRRF